MALHPGHADYERALAELFNGDAAACDPLMILQPRCEQDVVDAVLQARQAGVPLMVRSGGHSRFCAADGALVLDLSAHFTAIELEDHQVRVQAGVGMGALLQALSPHRCMLPVGTHATPGFGLLLMGGIGHLSRSLGLTLDSIVALRGVRADGTPFVLQGEAQDPKSWRLLRGAAPFLAVITEATLRTHARRSLDVMRSLHALEKLQNHLQEAEVMPRSRSCSFVLGVPPDSKEPSVLSYVVNVAEDSDVSPCEADSVDVWRDRVMGLEDLPDFNMPLHDGSFPMEPAADTNRRRRLRSWIHAISVKPGQTETLTSILTKAIQRAPNPLCRIDLQHIGGAVRDQAMHSSTYKGRDAEWSIVISGLWHPDDSLAGPLVRQWSDALFDALAPICCHVYLVERHPGTIRYGRQLQLAYAEDLALLREIKRRWDPDQILPTLDVPSQAGE
ncbi:6-hydroxy-D-nicotine oxidase [Synechococcus sp. MIT S9509]|uniref:FAD-binding oxidoreductase n=1 Tax=unclassified Synechococcus TaxID=2626047 RepID=UPI0007BBF6B2|nr:MULTISPECIES: FAD-binding oxidoreductase [unclassified Synechococcus]KZR85350.1 6-hydroxy-D-nicotine oxidase [Synechococcus sp. MIT S9504]KZR91501.1 6-hydroxy-D-nicotine oxidase [Synechococcus sp. MIT S9509]